MQDGGRDKFGDQERGGGALVTFEVDAVDGPARARAQWLPLEDLM